MWHAQCRDKWKINPGKIRWISSEINIQALLFSTLLRVKITA
jgi:hypothetical protein